MKYKVKLVLKEKDIEIANQYAEYLENQGFSVSCTAKNISITGELNHLEKFLNIEVQYDTTNPDEYVVQKIDYTLPEELQEDIESVYFSNKLVDLYNKYGSGDIMGDPYTSPPTKEEMEKIKQIISEHVANRTPEEIDELEQFAKKFKEKHND